MSLISLLVAVIVIGLVCWVVGQVSSAFKIPAPIVTVIYVILVVGVVLWLLQFLGGPTGPVLRLR